ncbi:MAG: hypothetical protein R2828_00890 [Saprospiraceae bacterium]
MASLTLKHGIIKKKGEDLTPEHGFDLIIQEDQNYRFIPEGSPKQKKDLLSIIKRKKWEVFAISNDRTHRIKSDKVVPHIDGIHSFYLDFNLIYGIGEDEEDKFTFVKKHARDPLGKLKIETGNTLAKYLKSIDWRLLNDPAEVEKIKAMAMEDFISIGRGESIQIFDYLNNYANDLGLTIYHIDFDVTIPEEHLEVRIKNEEFETEEKVKTREINKNIVVEGEEQKLRVDKTLNENELRDIERREKVKDTFFNTIGNYVDRVGNNIAQDSRSTEDAIRDIKDVMRLKEVVNDNAIAGPGQGNSHSLLYEGTLGENNLTAAMAEILMEIKKAKLALETQKQLLSALFHLLGGFLAKEEKIDLLPYQEQLLAIKLPRELVEFLELKLTDINDLINKNQLL